MGIDIFLHWDGETDEEKKARFNGDSGYLRESYGASHYATSVLLIESWSDDCWDGETDLPAGMYIVQTETDIERYAPRPAITLAELESRLPAAEAEAALRYAGDPEWIAGHQKALRDFVALARAKLVGDAHVWVTNSY